MLTSASVHWILNTLNVTVHIRDVCVFLAPMFRSVASSYFINLLPGVCSFDVFWSIDKGLKTLNVSLPLGHNIGLKVCLS